MKNLINFTELIDPRVCDPQFRPLDKTTEAEQVMQEIDDLFHKDADWVSIAESYRLQMDRFTNTTAIKPRGTTYTNVMGTYILGQSPKKRTAMSQDKISKRVLCEELYAQACISGVNKTIEKINFRPNPENNYNDLSELYVAVELDNSGKKGPFDGGNDDIALKVCDDLCAEFREPKELEEESLVDFNRALNRRYQHYTEVIRRTFKYSPESYLSRIAAKGITDTYRGAPFNASGNTTVNKKQLVMLKWMTQGFLPDDWFPVFNGTRAKTKLSNKDKFEGKKSKVNKQDPDTVAFKTWKDEKLQFIRSKFFHLGDVKVKDKVVQAYVDDQNRPTYDDLTCDYVIQCVLLELEARGVDYVDFFNTLRHALIAPISRDQGMPFKTKITSKGYLKLTTEGLKRKYRPVIPCSAIAQAILIVATADLVDNAPKTPSRIGLQDPITNVQRMNDWIHETSLADLWISSTDFDTYDAHLLSQLMIGNTVMYSALYDDPRMKNVLLAAGIILAHKLALLPMYVNETGHNYDAVHHKLFPKIKGDKHKDFARKYRYADPETRRRELERLEGSWDYKVGCFYVWKSWLISGVILTNTTGSDCTAEMGQDMLPLQLGRMSPIMAKWLENHSVDELSAIASGDDCCNSLPIELYNELGYEGCLQLIEKAYAMFNMIVKAAKQVKIMWRGLPIVDFLQNVYPQGKDSVALAFNQPYKKFMRQMPGMPYRERFSKHPLISQWDSIIGRFDSCLCQANIDFAASVIYHGGQDLTRFYQKSRVQPDVDRSWYINDEQGGWEKKYAVNNSTFMGLEQLFGLVKTYGKNVLAEITKYEVDEISTKYADDPDKRDRKVSEYINDYRSDRETRAPHREGEERIAFSLLSERDKKTNGIASPTNDDVKGFSTYLPELVTSMERQFNIAITPVELRPTTKVEETEDEDVGPSVEDL